MLVIPPVVFRKRQRAKDAARSSSSAARVLSVYIVDGTAALWVFDSPVTVEDGSPCPQLRIQTAGGWEPVVSMGSVSPYLVACDYETGVLDPSGGQAWEIVEQPAGFDFGGSPLVLPQTGTTVR